MKKYIFTEEQIKKVIDSVVLEQQSGFDAVYNNPPITQQMRKYPQGTKFGFSPAKAAEISKMSHSNILSSFHLFLHSSHIDCTFLLPSPISFCRPS